MGNLNALLCCNCPNNFFANISEQGLSIFYDQKSINSVNFMISRNDYSRTCAYPSHILCSRSHKIAPSWQKNAILSQSKN